MTNIVLVAGARVRQRLLLPEAHSTIDMQAGRSHGRVTLQQNGALHLQLNKLLQSSSGWRVDIYRIKSLIKKNRLPIIFTCIMILT